MAKLTPSTSPLCTIRTLTVCCSPTSVSCGAGRTALVALLLLMLLSMPGTDAYARCRYTFRCANGGVERYGQDIFMTCRCICPAGYTGPRCQYRHVNPKRSSFNVLADFLHNSLSQQQQQRRTTPETETAEVGIDEPLEEEERTMSGERRHPRFFFRR